MSPTVSEVFRRSVRHPRNPVSAGDLWRRGRRRRVTRMVGVLAGGTLVAVVAIGAVAQLVSRPSVVEVVAPPDEEVNRACSPEPPSSEGWTAWPVTLDEDAFTVDVDRFNEFLHDATPPVSTSPCDAARVFARLDQPSDEPDDLPLDTEVVVEPEGVPDATVTITQEGFADDSTHGARWVLTFEEQDDGTVRLVSGSLSQRCQPGRGHQDYRPASCV
jgi:hypothetical protein